MRVSYGPVLTLVASTLTLVILGLAAPAPVAAQSIRLIPQVGVYVPVSELGEVTGDGFDGAYSFGKKESTRAYGLGVEIGGGGFVGLRGSAAYATSSEIPFSGFGCTTCQGRSSMMALTAGAVVRPFRLLLVDTYFLGGIGVKRYDFSASNVDDLVSGSLDNRYERAYQLGVGAELNLGFLSGLVEVADYISTGESLDGTTDRQHDFVVSIGLGLGR